LGEDIMAKDLPYFRWWVARAETDEKYSSMTREEKGLYHECLNKSWLNGGIPVDVSALCKLLHISEKDLSRLWVAVGQCWYEEDGRLFNSTQEEERRLAIAKSENNKRPGNANAKRTRITREANGTQRAYDSVCVSSSVLSKEDKISTRASDLDGIVSERFDEVFSRWPRKTNRDNACRDWVSLVTVEIEPKVFACVDRYLGSAEVERGAVRNLGSSQAREGWLVECARDRWECDWPKANGNGKEQSREIDYPTFGVLR
jgi:uncharacterized protein YdaU (DUF1376 family)